MTDPRSEEFLRPYRDAVARHGSGFEATLWGTREAQHLRFDVMIDLAGLAGCAILDVGCGPGALPEHLLERDVAFTEYLGLDALPEVIDDARRKDLPRCRFEVRDVLEGGPLVPGASYDFACLSGTLNTMDERTARRLVLRCYESVAQGVVFNFLSERHDPKWNEHRLGPARRFDPLRWLDTRTIVRGARSQTSG